LQPVLTQVGEKWDKGEFSLAQGYVAHRIVDDALNRFQQQPEPSAVGWNGLRPVVLGNAEDDLHGLGLRIVSTFLQSAGWEVHNLGTDVEHRLMVDRAEETGARVIGVSAMIFTTAENIRRVRDEIDRRGLGGRIRLAVGGAVFKFRPELVDLVGGDGTAANASMAPALVERLWALGGQEEDR
jgi:methanogenic corrinoid protein MtbC1